MVQISDSVSITFLLTTALTFFFFLKAARYSKIVFVVLLTWLLVQGTLAYIGFYQNLEVVPPRIFLTFIPTFLLIIGLFSTRSGRDWISKLNLKELTLLHLVRIPVELVLYALFVDKAIPELMTFAGRNFDILAGLTAPLVYYFGFVKTKISRKGILAWNIICLLLLLNIVVNALLSAPLPIQQFAFDQPNLAILYFPITLLPAFVVPLVLFAHLIAITKLVNKPL